MSHYLEHKRATVHQPRRTAQADFFADVEGLDQRASIAAAGRAVPTGAGRQGRCRRADAVWLGETRLTDQTGVKLARYLAASATIQYLRGTSSG